MLAKEASVCKQSLVQHNLNTCCAELHEIARHIRSRESVLFPPSKEEKKKIMCTLSGQNLLSFSLLILWEPVFLDRPASIS